MTISIEYDVIDSNQFGIVIVCPISFGNAYNTKRSINYNPKITQTTHITTIKIGGTPGHKGLIIH